MTHRTELSKQTEDRAVAYIASYSKLKGYPPLIREIAHHLDMSKSGAWSLLERLEDKGRIRRGAGARAIVVKGKS